MASQSVAPFYFNSDTSSPDETAPHGALSQLRIEFSSARRQWGIRERGLNQQLQTYKELLEAAEEERDHYKFLLEQRDSDRVRRGEFVKETKRIMPGPDKDTKEASHDDEVLFDGFEARQRFEKEWEAQQERARAEKSSQELDVSAAEIEDSLRTVSIELTEEDKRESEHTSKPIECSVADRATVLRRLHATGSIERPVLTTSKTEGNSSVSRTDSSSSSQDQCNDKTLAIQRGQAVSHNQHIKPEDPSSSSLATLGRPGADLQPLAIARASPRPGDSAQVLTSGNSTPILRRYGPLPISPSEMEPAGPQPRRPAATVQPGEARVSLSFGEAVEASAAPVPPSTEVSQGRKNGNDTVESAISALMKGMELSDRTKEHRIQGAPRGNRPLTSLGLLGVDASQGLGPPSVAIPKDAQNVQVKEKPSYEASAQQSYPVEFDPLRCSLEEPKKKEPRARPEKRALEAATGVPFSILDTTSDFPGLSQLAGPPPPDKKQKTNHSISTGYTQKSTSTSLTSSIVRDDGNVLTLKYRFKEHSPEEDPKAAGGGVRIPASRILHSRPRPQHRASAQSTYTAAVTARSAGLVRTAPQKLGTSPKPTLSLGHWNKEMTATQAYKSTLDKYPDVPSRLLKMAKTPSPASPDDYSNRSVHLTNLPSRFSWRQLVENCIRGGALDALVRIGNSSVLVVFTEADKCAVYRGYVESHPVLLDGQRIQVERKIPVITNLKLYAGRVDNCTGEKYSRILRVDGLPPHVSKGYVEQVLVKGFNGRRIETEFFFVNDGWLYIGCTTIADAVHCRRCLEKEIPGPDYRFAKDHTERLCETLSERQKPSSHLL